MNLKYIPKYIFLTAALMTNLAIADEHDFDFDSINDTTFDSVDIEPDDESGNSDSLDDLVSDITFSNADCCCSTAELGFLLPILDTLKVPLIFDKAFYRKTSIPRSRNLINFPEMQITTYADLADRQFTTHLFANLTPLKDFRNSTEHKPGTRIGSYLNIENKEVTNLFQRIIDFPFITPDTKSTLESLDIHRLLKAFGNAKLQEGRFGIFMHYFHRINDATYFQVKLPVFWMLRALNFNQKDKEIIDEQLSTFINSGSGTHKKFDENAFARRHIVFDALGIGTLEISANHKIIEGINWNFDIGGGLLLPTDYHIKRGLYGTYFKPKDEAPLLNFCEILDFSNFGGTEEGFFRPGGKEKLEEYFTSALNKLSSILLACNTGYAQHPGIVLNAHAFWQIVPNLEFNTKYAVEFLLPHENDLFFVPKNSGTFSAEYAALPSDTSEEQLLKLEFLEKRITELLFPRVFSATVFPGFIFNSTSCLQKTFRNWTLTGGTSSYYQTAEKILKVQGLTKEEIHKYDVCKALNEATYNFKIFGKIHRIFHTRHHNDYAIGIWADGTILNAGLGNDFSFGISFDSKF